MIYKNNFKTLFFCIATMLLQSSLTAQSVWTNTNYNAVTSPTIEQVYIDACANPEGYNEFAYMKVGSVAYDWSNLEITGSNVNYTVGLNSGASTNPSLNYRPISNAFTSDAAIVAQLNAAIGACSTPVFYVAPNPLPAGAMVLIRMSSAPVTTSSLSHLCGKNPIYVLAGSYFSSQSATGFFRNSSASCSTSTSPSNTNPCTRFATFYYGNPNATIQELSYDSSLIPLPSSSTIGVYISKSGLSSTTSSCYEPPPCATTLAAPVLTPTSVAYCSAAGLPTTKFICNNCTTGNYLVQTTTGNVVYNDVVNAFPPANFSSPLGNTSYNVTQKQGVCLGNPTIIQINNKQSPTISAIPNVTISCATPLPDLSVTASGGAPFSYTWNTFLAGAKPNIGSPGVYSVTVTNNVNCTASTTIIVTANTTPCVPRLSAKIFLDAFVPSAALMSNISRVSNFPYIDPYTTRNIFTPVNNPTLDSTTTAVLAITGNNAIVDWVFIELRVGTSGNTSVAYTKAALLQKDGDIVAMDGVSPVSFANINAGNYYVGIRHRNHLGFRTVNTYPLTSPIQLNFSNNTIPLFGTSPMNQVATNLATMVPADGNYDGSIDAIDSTIWELQNGSFDDYTLNTDYNLDGSIDSIDSAIWEVHSGKYEEMD